jgi:cohesin loading factor subunit SCC2
MYQALLDRIVDASESTQVTLRTKALRAVSLVVAQDPDLFHQDNIRRTIENRMLDSSPAVRDATIELVGKYVVSRPDLAKHYLPKLGERISDTGLSVRRRVVKLLKVLYSVVDDQEQRVDVCRRLVYRVLDEDDGIKASLRVGLTATHS